MIWLLNTERGRVAQCERLWLHRKAEFADWRSQATQRLVEWAQLAPWVLAAGWVTRRLLRADELPDQRPNAGGHASCPGSDCDSPTHASTTALQLGRWIGLIVGALRLHDAWTESSKRSQPYAETVEASAAAPSPQGGVDGFE